MNNRKKFMLLFGTYSYINNILYNILNLLPFFIRGLIYKILFKKIGKDVYIDYECNFRYPSKIIIGNNVTINRGSKFFGSYYEKEVIIKIGNNVAIAPYVTFFAASHDYNSIHLPDIAKSIIIEDNVWIGGHSIVFPGVTIGEGSIIGAGSVVTKSIPEWSVAVGNPAKIIKKRELIDNFDQ